MNANSLFIGCMLIYSSELIFKFIATITREGCTRSDGLLLVRRVARTLILHRIKVSNRSFAQEKASFQLAVRREHSLDNATHC